MSFKPCPPYIPSSLGFHRMALLHHQFPLKICSYVPPISKTTNSRTLICNSKSQSPAIISISTSTDTTHTPAPVLHCFTSSYSSVEEDEPHSTRIFIKGLARSVAEGFLMKTFSRFGQISKVKIIMDKKGVQPLGFAYVWFTKEDSAQSAVKEMNGKFFCGRYIFVTIAKPESPTSQRKFKPYRF